MSELPIGGWSTVSARQPGQASGACRHDRSRSEYAECRVGKGDSNVYRSFNWVGERQHSPTGRLNGRNMLDEVGGGFRHPARATARAEAAAFATELYQFLMPAGIALDAQESVFEASAFQVRLELFVDEAGQRSSLSALFRCHEQGGSSRSRIRLRTLACQWISSTSESGSRTAKTCSPAHARQLGSAYANPAHAAGAAPSVSTSPAKRPARGWVSKRGARSSISSSQTWCAYLRQPRSRCGRCASG